MLFSVYILKCLGNFEFNWYKYCWLCHLFLEAKQSGFQWKCLLKFGIHGCVASMAVSHYKEEGKNRQATTDLSKSLNNCFGAKCNKKFLFLALLFKLRKATVFSVYKLYHFGVTTHIKLISSDFIFQV